MSVPLSTGAVYAGVVALLLGLHLLVSWPGFTIQAVWLNRLGVTPATTLSQWWRHLEAGLFHTTPGHILFNLALFTLAFPFAARAHDPLRTVLGAYWLGPFVVFGLHLVLVLPLAKLGVPYAVSALDRPLVGFSVIAYATTGMALAGLSLPWALGLGTVAVAFELTGGVLLNATGPFIFVYHLGGLAAGFAARAFFRQPA